MFNYSVGEVFINGEERKKLAGRDMEVSFLEIKWAGVEIQLSKDSPLFLLSNDGLVHEVVPKSYRIESDSFSIIFDSDLVLDIQKDDWNISTKLEFSSANAISIRQLRLPFRIVQKFRYENNGDQSTACIIDDQNSQGSIIYMPKSANVDTDDNCFNIEPMGKDFGALEIISDLDDPRGQISAWLLRQELSMSEEEYDLALDNYFEKATSAWLTSRYNPSTGTWTSSTGPRFVPEIASALLSEQFGTPGFAALLSRIRAAETRNGSSNIQNSILTAPFTGELADKAQDRFQQNQVRIDNLVLRLQEDDFGIFNSFDLADLILETGNYQLNQNIYTLIQKMRPLESSLTRQLGLFSYYLQAKELEWDLVNSLHILSRLPEFSILSSLILIDDQIFLETEPQTTDLYLTIICGALLQKAGEIDSEELFTQIGRIMVESALRYSDQRGFIPGTMSFYESGEAAGRSGSITPESVYSFLRTSSNYPRPISLAAQGLPGAWLYNANDGVGLKVEPGSHTYRFSYPASQSEFIMIKGIRPVRSLRLRDIPWPQDPAFENYHSGWYYDSDYQALFIKITHRQLIEEIVINF